MKEKKGPNVYSHVITGFLNSSTQHVARPLTASIIGRQLYRCFFFINVTIVHYRPAIISMFLFYQRYNCPLSAGNYIDVSFLSTLQLSIIGRHLYRCFFFIKVTTVHYRPAFISMFLFYQRYNCPLSAGIYIDVSSFIDVTVVHLRSLLLKYRFSFFFLFFPLIFFFQEN